MINGILDLKNNITSLVLIGILSLMGCKEKQPTETDITQVEAQTNIRFATKTDGYNEKSNFARLKTKQSAITSTQFQMEGPAWENEYVAFRNYFDGRNGIDIFGKTTTNMVLDSVGIDENYHEIQDWGMDILKVGNSLGAGAIGMIIKDSLYRIAEKSEGSFRIIEETPKSSTLEFTFNNWIIQDRKYEVVHTITIKSGTHYYQGEIKVEGLKGDETLVTGIVDHGVGTSEIKTDKYTILSTHGTQEVEGRTLGMAIATDKNTYKGADNAKEYQGSIDKTHLVLLDGNHARYKFFAGWELQDVNFKSKEKFEKMVLSELE